MPKKEIKMSRKKRSEKLGKLKLISRGSSSSSGGSGAGGDSSSNMHDA
jgi:hypothetical protein